MAGFGFGTNIISEGIFQLAGGRPKGKPDWPEMVKADPTKIIKDLVAGSKANLPEINELVTGLNQFIAQEATRLAESFLPGFADTQRAFMDVAKARAQGQLSPQEQAALRRESAALGITQGTLPSRNVPGGFANLSHLARTADQVQQSIGFGSDLASAATQRARAFAPQIASPFSFLFTPAQAAELEQFNETNRFNIERAKAIQSWLPSQSQLGWANAIQSDFDQTISTVASAFTGGALGGMGGMMGGGGAGAGGGGGGGGGWQGFMNLFGGGGGGGMTIDTFGNPVKTSNSRPNYG